MFIKQYWDDEVIFFWKIVTNPLGAELYFVLVNKLFW